MNKKYTLTGIFNLIYKLLEAKKLNSLKKILNE